MSCKVGFPHLLWYLAGAVHVFREMSIDFRGNGVGYGDGYGACFGKGYGYGNDGVKYFYGEYAGIGVRYSYRY